MPLTHRNYHEEMAVHLPEAESGACRIQRFTVEKQSLENIRYAFMGRGTAPGEYTKLVRNGSLWMSDTDAERRDHYEAARVIGALGGRVLVGGLGLGMILRVALFTPEVEHVDVVEIDSDVIALAGPAYQAMAAERGITLTIHHADLFSMVWPSGTRWNVAWFDVWPSVSTDDLAEMSKLRRSYGRRTDWNDCWARDSLVRRRRQENRSRW